MSNTREPVPTQGKPRRPMPPMLSSSAWIAMLATVAIMVFLVSTDQFTGRGRIPYSEFKRQLQEGNIARLRIGPGEITGELKDKDKLAEEFRKKRGAKDLSFSTIRSEKTEDTRLLEQLDEQARRGEVTYELVSDAAGQLVSNLIFFALVLGLVAVFLLIILPRIRDTMGGGFVSSYIKNPAKRYERGRTRVTFDDVAGMENAKRELSEIVDFLKNPEKYHKLGGTLPRGVLLVGPPGTGKTLMAKAVAGEAAVPFYSVSASEFIQLFVGVGASRVRDLFKVARESAPCIIFVDELDTIGRIRGSSPAGGHDSEREQTLNQILAEMDGFLPTESVIVLAATNRPDVLDPALLRPGRFDRHVTIDKPTLQGRLAILKVHTRDKPLAADVKLEEIARTTIGMTGADLRNLANEAALFAARENKTRIERRDFLAAVDRVRLGAKGEKIPSAEEKRRTAYHEAGHAIAAKFQPKSLPVERISIVPRGRAAGATQLLPNEDRIDWSREELFAQLVMILGGRAADSIIYGDYNTGAVSDLQHATQLALQMVTRFGMSDKLGPVAYRQFAEHDYLGNLIGGPREFSESTLQLIDEEVRRIVQAAEQKAHENIRNQRATLDLVVEALLQREELTREEFELLLATGRLDALPPLLPVEEPKPAPSAPAATATDTKPVPEIPGLPLPLPS